ncbi:MAG TPA: hypothetical protein VG844_05585 [Terracidiphilus sp.]|nr:hypothetical protein [Terracidiphilus sp.]
MPTGVCKLCLLDRELLASHYLPAGVFSQLRVKSKENPNPVLITKEVTLTSSRQPKDFVLCAECEERFNENGERWVLANMAREESFHLQAFLSAQGPIDQNEDFAIFAGAKIQSVNIDALVYFAMSIFWRSSIHSWPGITSRTEQLNLREFLEPIRQFLLGGKFPQNAAIFITVWPKLDVPRIAYTPREGEAPGYRVFNFMIPGIEFRLFLGSAIPPVLFQTCAQQSELRCIFSSTKLISETRDTLIKLARGSRIAKNLREDWPPRIDET